MIRIKHVQFTLRVTSQPRRAFTTITLHSCPDLGLALNILAPRLRRWYIQPCSPHLSVCSPLHGWEAEIIYFHVFDLVQVKAKNKDGYQFRWLTTHVQYLCFQPYLSPSDMSMKGLTSLIMAGAMWRASCSDIFTTFIATTVKSCRWSSCII